MKAYKIARTIYFIVGLVEIVSTALEYTEISQYSKPLLMPILIYYLIERTEGRVYKYHLFLAGALIFAWAGDVFLMWKDQTSFLIGLGSFLVMQIGYIIVFRLEINLSISEIIKSRFTYLVPYIVFGALYLYFVLPSIDQFMVIPVIAYSTCLISMSATAALRNKSIQGYREVLVGSILFVISDSLIGIRQFVTEFAFSHVYIMVTYILAQFLIVQGVVRKE